MDLNGSNLPIQINQDISRSAQIQIIGSRRSMEPRFGGVASASPRRTTPLVAAGPIQTRDTSQVNIVEVEVPVLEAEAGPISLQQHPQPIWVEPW